MRRTSWIEFALIIFMTVYYIVPSLVTVFDWYRFFELGLVYFFFATMVLIKDNAMRSKALRMFVVVFVASLLYSLLTDSVTVAGSNVKLKFFVSTFSQSFFTFFPAFLLYRVATSSSTFQKTVLLLIVSSAFLLVITNTFQELQINERITRINDVDRQNAQNNVGGYEFVYTVTGIVPVIAYCFFRANRFIYKTLFAVIMTLLFVFIFRAQYTLSLIISTISVLAIIYTSLPKGSGLRVLYFVAFFVVAFILPSILNMLASSTSSEDMSVRFGELQSFFTTGEAQGDMGYRMALYGQALTDFFHSPVWGNYSLPYNPHSTFLGWLAYTGLLGSLPLFYLYKESSRLLFRLMPGRQESFAFRVVIWTIILNGLTNPIHSNLSFATIVFFISPLILLEFPKINQVKHKYIKNG